MATDKEGILAPGTPEAKAPLKRGTLIGVALLILALMAFGALLAQQRRAAKAAEAEPDRVQTVGSAATIDAESDRVVVREVKVPAEVQRANESVAIENNRKPAEKDPRHQLESAGAMSKMIIADASEAEDALQLRDDGRQGRPNPMAMRSIPGIQEQVQAEGQAPQQETNPLLAAAIENVKSGAKSPRNNAEANASWLKEFAKEAPAPSNKPKVVKGRYVLAQGMQIPAILTKNIVSDLPGEITARTIVNVYDSFNGRELLIPKGTLLVGQYNAGVLVGQDRLLFAFKRMIMPNRVAFELPGANGMDLAGAAGLPGDVNNHFFKMFGTSLLLSVLSFAAEKGEPAPSGYGSTGGARTAAGEALVDVSRSILERNRNIAPTISIPAGTRLNVQVAGDMEFPSAYTGAMQ